MEFQLRRFQAEDAPALAKYANNPNIAANMRDVYPYPYTENDAVQYIRDTIAAGEERQLLRAIDIQGEAAGSIGIILGKDVGRKTAEIGYWLGEPFWGHGIVTQAVQAITKTAFTAYDIVRIYGEPFAHNTGSCKALEKAGFQLEGTLRKSIYKNGEIFDSRLYALVK